jgi:hypothetical protein
MRDQWINQTLCAVNDCVMRLGVLQGEFHWHKRSTRSKVLPCRKASFRQETREWM